MKDADIIRIALEAKRQNIDTPPLLAPEVDFGYHVATLLDAIERGDMAAVRRHGLRVAYFALAAVESADDLAKEDAAGGGG